MDIWRELTERGFAAIEDLCARQVPEGQHLEYKRKSNPDRLELISDDKKSLGESLSAMSNAEGGVLIMGMMDRRNDDGLDYPTEPQPLTDAIAVAGKIASLIPDYLSPPNTDIEVLPFTRSAQSNAGIVAIRIGRSNFRPHMSMAPDHRNYFLRTQATATQW